jgi:hypothetical protein
MAPVRTEEEPQIPQIPQIGDRRRPRRGRPDEDEAREEENLRSSKVVLFVARFVFTAAALPPLGHSA